MRRTTTSSRFRTLSRYLWACTALLAGCATPTDEQRFSDRQLVRRLGGMGYTIETAAKSESVRPANLRGDGEFVRDDVKRTARTFQADIDVAGQLIQADVDRFVGRQPVYARTAAQIFWGQPQYIPWNAIILFW